MSRALLWLALVGAWWGLHASCCLHCKHRARVLRYQQRRLVEDGRDWGSAEERLERVESVSCESSSSEPKPVDVPLPESHTEPLRHKADLAARMLLQVALHSGEQAGPTGLVQSFLNETLASDERFWACRLLLPGANGTASRPWVRYLASVSRRGPVSERRNFALPEVPWLVEDASEGRWSGTYYSCELRRWIASYTVPARAPAGGAPSALLSVDVDASSLDIDQCDPEATVVPAPRILAFQGTHRCHNRTSQCIFSPGQGWTRGSYVCQCRRGFYSPTGNPVFNGSLVEAAWKEKRLFGRPTYDMLYVCKPCQPGCSECGDDSPCLSHYNWAFRISLLTISVMCIVLTMVLAGYVYRFRKLKVIKVASPIFLCITLVGCAIMYCEMAAIFPVLDVYCCVATKWTRHMGFCITYSTLLLKTWRVSLTYRVKSAHKLKLTDKQLLQWLFPILLEMAIYLGTWTISSPPEGIYLEDWHGLKFKQCEYNWWDHTMAIGEFLFLLWGIRVCYNVRNAESFFNEAKHISWAIYNITIVNLIMMLIHLVILPSASPDVKYLFGFIRTQLSTTVTVILIFGPKFYRVIKGQGDMWDNRARARGVTASFSLNGVGLMHEETVDLGTENEELKEEVQKLAAQIEFMKIVHMEMNNRHLKPKHGGFFSSATQSNSTQSPVVKAMCIKFDSTDSPGSRISPAAELVSERV
ncbi:putative G-protein coupled receptor CG31760 [Ixodes scapularis]